uniref:Uncharacterized protein n=1 Tax=Nelumbo nucifera TaxID=4432 RepID=A0A822YZ61_NELNU|nr:TPA_asm: hypothetical protein HUJ06_013707 [Nelumbo nucifera]
MNKRTVGERKERISQEEEKKNEERVGGKKKNKKERKWKKREKERGKLPEGNHPKRSPLAKSG